jgi:hypothetical protein
MVRLLGKMLVDDGVWDGIETNQGWRDVRDGGLLSILAA